MEGAKELILATGKFMEDVDPFFGPCLKGLETFMKRVNPLYKSHNDGEPDEFVTTRYIFIIKPDYVVFYDMKFEVNEKFTTLAEIDNKLKFLQYGS